MRLHGNVHTRVVQEGRGTEGRDEPRKEG
jgi:hypothetical protein